MGGKEVVFFFFFFPRVCEGVDAEEKGEGGEVVGGQASAWFYDSPCGTMGILTSNTQAAAVSQ